MWEATWELMKAELGDKTFVILLILTLGWANPEGAYVEKDSNGNVTKFKSPAPGYRVYKDGRMEIHPRRTHVWPGRFYILATVGTIWMNAGGKLSATQARVCTSALILVYCLLQYAFRLMSAYFAIVTKLEAEYEFARGKEAQRRDGLVQEWAGREIQTSRDFNEAHMASVFEAFEKAEGADIVALKEGKASLFKKKGADAGDD